MSVGKFVLFCVCRKKCMFSSLVGNMTIGIMIIGNMVIEKSVVGKKSRHRHEFFAKRMRRRLFAWRIKFGEIDP